MTQGASLPRRRRRQTVCHTLRFLANTSHYECGTLWPRAWASAFIWYSNVVRRKAAKFKGSPQ